MTSCVSSAMMSPVPTSNTATSYPTPRTQSTAHMLTALKSSSKTLRNEISPGSTCASLSRPIGGASRYTFTEEEDQVEDKALNFLDRTGHLSQVAGSQSLLSQELLAHGEEQDSQSMPASQMSSLSTRSPKSIARRYGILTQEMEDENASTSSVRNDMSSFQTPPRKTTARKIVTAQDTAKKSSLDQDALHESQPSLSMSQLEAAVNEPILEGSQATATSFSQKLVHAAGHVKRTSSSSLVSLCAAAEKQSHQDQDFSQVSASSKRSYNPKSSAGAPPAAKKARTVSTGGRADPNEPLSTEIKWVGSASRHRGVEGEDHTIAKQAAELAHRIMQEGENDLAKRLLLSMALNRDSPRQPPAQWPPRGPIPEGFVWAHYPPLEALLKENMEEYYNLSMAKSQSTRQQVFNNNLVDRTRDVAATHGWEFPTDRRTLRDRIRCYFKTHLQNAKKRLRTLLRNPTKRANAKNLVKLMKILPEALPDLAATVAAAQDDERIGDHLVI